MRTFKNRDVVYQVAAMILVVGFFSLCWAMSMACIAIGYGPEVCGL